MIRTACSVMLFPVCYTQAPEGKILRNSQGPYMNIPGLGSMPAALHIES